jgi:aldose sugar dehydrogenase
MYGVNCVSESGVAYALLLLSLFSIWIPSVHFVSGEPVMNDPNLNVQVVYEGLDFPTSMAFVNYNDILVLEKDTGIVQRIVNGVMQSEPVLDASVANEVERGMLGIATTKDSNGSTRYVFVYYTEAEEDGGKALGNRLYRYEFEDNELKKPKLLLDLPADPGSKHEGGAIAIGPDNNVYLVVGDISGENNSDTGTKAQNLKNGPNPDGRAGILRVTQDGEVVEDKGILGNEDPLDKYFAYGIRNSFGIDFDPLTGNLWDTENGPWYGDEINFVEPGFNSGWMSVQGVWKPEGNEIGSTELNPSDLEDFGGMGKYSAPEFIWKNNVGPSAIKFLDSEIYGNEYGNDLIVGDVNLRNLYRFNLNPDRTELSLGGSLEDRIADSQEELDGLIFGKGMGRVTDIEIGPDGYLYILSHYSDGKSQPSGSIYKIVTRA